MKPHRISAIPGRAISRVMLVVLTAVAAALPLACDSGLEAGGGISSGSIDISGAALWRHVDVVAGETISSRDLESRLDELASSSAPSIVDVGTMASCLSAEQLQLAGEAEICIPLAAGVSSTDVDAIWLSVEQLSGEYRIPVGANGLAPTSPLCLSATVSRTFQLNPFEALGGAKAIGDAIAWTIRVESDGLITEPIDVLMVPDEQCNAGEFETDFATANTPDNLTASPVEPDEVPPDPAEADPPATAVIRADETASAYFPSLSGRTGAVLVYVDGVEIQGSLTSGLLEFDVPSNVPAGTQVVELRDPNTEASLASWPVFVP